MSHPYSLPGAIERVPGSLWLLASEGGALAFLDGNTREAFGDEIGNVKRVPISSFGVVPVEMRMDPDATLNDATLHAEDLVYIAGGRFGFWVMQAHPGPTIPLSARRVDDHDSAAPDGDSARWCSAVDVVEIGETRYLAVLFSARANNRLRLYPLQDVRDLFAGSGPWAELGSELTATVEVALDEHEDWQPTPGTNGFAEAFGYGMDVLGSDIYVALGTHGLVRVEFDPQDLQNPVVQGGPVFGTGSYYATTLDPLFGDLVYWRNPSNPLLAATVERSHPPFFGGLVAYSHGGKDYLIASVDHLGWLRLNLTDDGFDHEMDIEYHPGETYDLIVAQQQPNQEARSLVGNGVTGLPTHAYTYARRLDLCQTPLGPALAVAVHAHPLWLFPGCQNEGRQVGSVLDMYGGVRLSVTGPIQGHYRWTLLYRLHPPAAAHPELVTQIRGGGGYVKILQPILTGGEEEPMGDFQGGGSSSLLYPPLIVYTGAVKDTIGVRGIPDSVSNAPVHLDGRQAALRVKVAWDPVDIGEFDPDLDPDPYTYGDVWHRSAEGRPGWMIREMVPSLGDHNVLLLGGNDSGLIGMGLVAACNAIVRTFPFNQVGGAHGIIFDHGSQWVPDPQSGLDGNVVIGQGSKPAYRDIYQAVVMKNGDPCADPPDAPSVSKVVFFQPILDRYIGTLRIFLAGAGRINLDYENDIGKQVLFLTVHKTPEGVVAFPRDVIEARIDSFGHEAVVELPEENPPIEYGKLDTHPEYQNIPTYPAPGIPLDFLGNGNNKLNVSALLQTYFPQLVKLRGPESMVRDRWVLVVPSGSVQFPWDHPFQDDHELIAQNWPDWLPPSEFLAHNDRLMVRLFDVTNPEHIAGPGASFKEYTLLGPNQRSHAARVEVVDFEDRTWCFVADFGGSVVVYDLTDILQSPSGAIFQAGSEHAIWHSPEGISDNLPRNIPTVLPEIVDGRLIVYASVWRHGLAVLEFHPDEIDPADRLQHLKTIQTPGTASGLAFREVGSEKQLIVTDEAAGFRIYRRATQE